MYQRPENRLDGEETVADRRCIWVLRLPGHLVAALADADRIRYVGAMSRIRYIGVAAVAFGLLACDSEGTSAGPDAGDAPAQLSRHAVVHVTAVSSRTTGVPTHIQVQGQLVAWAGVERQPLFDALGLWTPRMDADACRILDEPVVEAPGLEVHFEDVGPLWLSAQGNAQLISPRTLPSVGSSIDGMIYAASGPVFDEHAAPGRLHIGFPGIADSPVWPVVVPSPVRIAQVDGVDPGTSSRIPVSGSEEVPVDLASEAAVLDVLIRPATGAPWPVMECRVLSTESMILDPAEMERWFGDAPLELVVLSRQIVRSTLADRTPVDVVLEWRDSIVLDRH